MPKWGDKGVYEAPRRKMAAEIRRYEGFQGAFMWSDDLDLMRRQMGDERFKELWNACVPSREIIQTHWFGNETTIGNVVVFGTAGGVNI